MADDSAALRARAEQCRRLSRGVSTAELAETLRKMGADYQQQADDADAEAAAAASGPATPAG